MSNKASDKTGWPERPTFPQGDFTADRARNGPAQAIFEALLYVGDQLARIAYIMEEQHNIRLNLTINEREKPR